MVPINLEFMVTAKAPIEVRKKIVEKILCADVLVSFKYTKLGHESATD